MRLIYVIISISVIVFVILSLLTIRLMRKKKNQAFEKEINDLEIKKNNLSSMPVMVELSKIEDIAKSEQLEEKIAEFKSRYEEIKTTKITKINDMITNLELTVSKRNVKEYINKYSDIELEIDEAEYSLNNIMHEIDEIASYEEKYRSIITKLKGKYRYLEHCYTEKEPLLKDLQDVIKMQFENIAKRFNDFDKVMDEKLYNEVVLIVKSIDTMIDNLDVVLRELPDILLLLNDLIPGRIKDLKEEYTKMVDEGYPLGYMNLDENLLDIEKKESDILTRAKVLNINDSLFDLRTILEYLDSLFKDLEAEKKAKETFDSLNEIYVQKEEKLDKTVKDIYEQLDDIKAMYHLNEKDLEIIDELNLKFASITKDYKKLKRDIKKGKDSYKKHNMVLNELLNRINNTNQNFDDSLRALGSFYEDEMHAKDELVNMKNLHRKCQNMLRTYNLPIIFNNFFVEEEEALDSIREVEKELKNKPIAIKNLNMRVDTARDLTFKLYATTDEMVKYAYYTEVLMVYGNKYRNDKSIDKTLTKAEKLYYRGSYKESFDLILQVLGNIDSELVNKINKAISN